MIGDFIFCLLNKSIMIIYYICGNGLCMESKGLKSINLSVCETILNKYIFNQATKPLFFIHGVVFSFFYVRF